MGYERLEKSLTDTIKEEQAKLGFRKEAIRLYYPLSSLNHFFDVQEGEEQMLHRLAGKTRGCRCDGKKRAFLFLYSGTGKCICP